MAEILRIDGDRQYIEMTQQDWDRLHQDFKSDPGKPKKALMLVRGGTCSFPVRIVNEQKLFRRLKVSKRADNLSIYEVGTIAKIKDQDDAEARLITADVLTVRAKLDEIEEVKLTGISLSLCVRDILQGKISEQDVGIIYCGFDVWEGRPVEYYYKSYFKEWPKEEVDALLDRLNIKPALCEHRNISQGHWMVGEATEQRLADHYDRFDTDRAMDLLRRLADSCV